MKIETAHVGAVCLDSLPFSQGGTAETVRVWKAFGVSCFIGYLGAMNPTRLGYVLDAGLAFMPVTFGGEYEDGAADEVAQLRALGIPTRNSDGTIVTVWLDLEGLKAFKSDPVALAAKINEWATAIVIAGFQPGLYVGNPQPFTSAELYALKVVRYWKGQGRCVDRNNALAEPGCGWCMDQKWPSVSAGGLLVDYNMIGHDYQGRAPSWVVAD